MRKPPHPEDIKAEIRKRHRTIAAFERARSLPARSVKDVLRGRSRPKIAQAISDELGIAPHILFPKRFTHPISPNESPVEDG